MSWLTLFNFLFRNAYLGNFGLLHTGESFFCFANDENSISILAWMFGKAFSFNFLILRIPIDSLSLNLARKQRTCCGPLQCLSACTHNLPHHIWLVLTSKSQNLFNHESNHSDKIMCHLSKPSNRIWTEGFN